MSGVVVVGVSHRRTPADLREKVHVDTQGAEEVARELAGPDGEAVCLSTCQRTELYLAHADVELAAERGRSLLARLAGESAALQSPLVDVHTDRGAIVHLFRVAAGLDSLVVGETEILHQIRKASAAGAKGPVLERLFAEALRTGKRVRNETEIAGRPGSIPAAAVERAAHDLGDLADRRAVVVGAGRMGEAAGLQLRARGVRELVLVNRTPARACRVGARRVGFAALPDELRTADVVISCTSAPGFVVSAGAVAAARGGRHDRLVLVDLAVPRDVEPAVERLPGCRLYHLDDLREERTTMRAERLVSEAADRFREWQAALVVVPTIVSLRTRAETIRREALAGRGNELAALSPRERGAVEALTAQLVARLLHEATVDLKATAVRSRRAHRSTTGENADFPATGSGSRCAA